MFRVWGLGIRIRGILGDINPLGKVPLILARSRVKKVPLYGVSLILPRKSQARHLFTDS